MYKVEVELDLDIPEHLKDCLTFQTAQILRVVEDRGICFFVTDDTYLAQMTLEQLQEILSPIGGFIMKRNDYQHYAFLDLGRTAIDWV